jgi:sensor histidine kinase YesM
MRRLLLKLLIGFALLPTSAYGLSPEQEPSASFVIIVFVALALPSLIGLLLVLRMKRRLNEKIREAERSRTELTQRLADLEMKVLRSQMNPHFIFNSLNSINRYIVKSDAETASAYLTKFGKLIRLILDNSNHRLISLDQELNALRLYIELEALRFNGRFTWSISVGEEVNPQSFGIPPLVFQPFIENAIWHGLLHKEEAGHLSIVIKGTNSGIVCIIEDNGIGRKKAGELKSKSINSNKSYGLKITSERIGTISNDSHVQIEDLSDEFGNASGTKVTLTIARSKLDV